MVVRGMSLIPIVQCDRRLDFSPRAVWPMAMPAVAWRGILLTGFERTSGDVLDLWQNNRCTWVEAFTSVYPSLGLAELARLHRILASDYTILAYEYGESLFSFYGLRWNDRLSQTIKWLGTADREFQDWVDEKKLGARDLAPLTSAPPMNDWLKNLIALPLSKSQVVKAIENGVDLHMMGRPLTELCKGDTETAENYFARLETMRRPQTAGRDQAQAEEILKWPWPAQTRAEWRRQGDQAGLEIHLRAVSPADLKKKLERLNSIGDTWSCKT